MTTLAYPSSLPAPTVATIQSSERRQLAPDGGPFVARAFQRDRLATQQVEFPIFNAVRSAAFYDWWLNTLFRGGAWFTATWPLPAGLTSATRRFLGEPTWTYVGKDLWKVTAVCLVRGRGMLPDNYIDPYWDEVVSLLLFKEAAETDAALDADTEPYDTDDLKGVAWTLQSFNKIAGVAGSGQLVLPAWGLSQSPITRVVLHSDVTPSFAASGDLTMELTWAPDNTRGNFTGSSAITLVSGLSNAHGTGPVTTGEWMLTHSGGSGSLGFTVKTPSGTVSAGVSPSPLVAGPNEIAIQRISGIWSILWKGNTVAIQAAAADSTTLFDQVTFAANGNGSQISDNNLGSGTYSRWRYTVGVGRFPGGSYVPDGRPFLLG